MAEYLSPGVYVEEIETGPRPIEGVSTSTTGMVGQTERGPTVPRLVTSWEEYTRWYGDYIDRVPGGTACKFLPYAVKGFFDNSGQRVFIARIVPTGATAASTNLAGSPGSTLVQANGPGLWGNHILVRITAASLDPEVRVVLSADGTTPHSKIVELLDMARRCGVKKLALGVTKP